MYQQGTSAAVDISSKPDMQEIGDSITEVRTGLSFRQTVSFANLNQLLSVVFTSEEGCIL